MLLILFFQKQLNDKNGFHRRRYYAVADDSKIRRGLEWLLSTSQKGLLTWKPPREFPRSSDRETRADISNSFADSRLRGGWAVPLYTEMKELYVDRLDGYIGESAKPKEKRSLIPLFLIGAAVVFGGFIWATMHLAGA